MLLGWRETVVNDPVLDFKYIEIMSGANTALSTGCTAVRAVPRLGTEGDRVQEMPGLLPLNLVARKISMVFRVGRFSPGWTSS